jgi:sec-independent protein translocase protein TatB
MLDIGFSEFLVVVVLAVLVLGPDKLPEAMKDFARFIKKIKKMWRDATADITKELEMEEMKEEIQKYKDELNRLQNETKIDNPIDSLNSRDMRDILK